MMERTISRYDIYYIIDIIYKFVYGDIFISKTKMSGSLTLN